MDATTPTSFVSAAGLGGRLSQLLYRLKARKRSFQNSRLMPAIELQAPAARAAEAGIVVEAPADQVRANGAVGSSDVELDRPDELCTTRGIEMPHEQCNGHGGGIAAIDKPDLGARGQRKPRRRVEVTVRGRRPAPTGSRREYRRRV
jgi:hypothetical protein